MTRRRLRLSGGCQIAELRQVFEMGVEVLEMWVEVEGQKEVEAGQGEVGQSGAAETMATDNLHSVARAARSAGVGGGGARS